MVEKVLILGGDGMLGHQLVSAFCKRTSVVATTRQGDLGFRPAAPVELRTGMDMTHDGIVEGLVRDVRPDVVVNAVGFVKQRDDAQNRLLNLQLNAVLPHRLSLACNGIGARLVQISTDCVFDGTRGMYREDDQPDALDVYGQTKHLGEVDDAHCITLRTSIIGLELRRHSSLIEWFLTQSGEVQGFTRAIFSGLTTRELSRVICNVVFNYPEMAGIWHVASRPISKFELLDKLSQLVPDSAAVVANESLVIDRSLDQSRFEEMTGYLAPSWDRMLEELAQDIIARKDGTAGHC